MLLLLVLLLKENIYINEEKKRIMCNAVSLKLTHIQETNTDCCCYSFKLLNCKLNGFSSSGPQEAQTFISTPRNVLLFKQWKWNAVDMEINI